MKIALSVGQLSEALTAALALASTDPKKATTVEMLKKRRGTAARLTLQHSSRTPGSTKETPARK